MMPRAGGQYVFLREAYSPLFGFLFGWAMFLVVQTGTIAAVAVAFAKFLGVFFPRDRGRSSISSSRSTWAATRVSLSRQQLVAVVLIVVPDGGEYVRPEARQVDPEHVHVHQDGRAARPDRRGPLRWAPTARVPPGRRRGGTRRPTAGTRRRPRPDFSLDGPTGPAAPVRPGHDRAAVLAIGLEQRDVHRRRDPRPGPHACPAP